MTTEVESAHSNEREKPVATFIRKRKGASKTNARKRIASDDDEDSKNDNSSKEKSAVIKIDKKSTANPLRQGTGAKRARRETKDNIDDSDSDEDDEHGVGVKFGDKGRNNRTSSPELDDDKTTPATKDNKSSDGLYHGAKNYTSQLPTGSSRYGPIKGPANVRTITLVDYQPDVCKDYKETGFCGFGDTCKFLHDRGDYLHGWQMENNFLSQPFQQRSSRNQDLEDESGENKERDEDDEDLPFACLICRQPFTDPVETKCGHFFCSSCAIKRYSKTPKCFACGSATGGIFNAAKKIIERQKKIDEANQADGAAAAALDSD